MRRVGSSSAPIITWRSSRGSVHIDFEAPPGGSAAVVAQHDPHEHRARLLRGRPGVVAPRLRELVLTSTGMVGVERTCRGEPGNAHRFMAIDQDVRLWVEVRERFGAPATDRLGAIIRTVLDRLTRTADAITTASGTRADRPAGS